MKIEVTKPQRWIMGAGGLILLFIAYLESAGTRVDKWLTVVLFVGALICFFVAAAKGNSDG